MSASVIVRGRRRLTSGGLLRFLDPSLASAPPAVRPAVRPAGLPSVAEGVEGDSHCLPLYRSRTLDKPSGQATLLPLRARYSPV
jgi:hypothetical protein